MVKTILAGFGVLLAGVLFSVAIRLSAKNHENTTVIYKEKLSAVQVQERELKNKIKDNEDRIKYLERIVHKKLNNDGDRLSQSEKSFLCDLCKDSYSQESKCICSNLLAQGKLKNETKDDKDKIRYYSEIVRLSRCEKSLLYNLCKGSYSQESERIRNNLLAQGKLKNEIKNKIKDNEEKIKHYEEVVYKELKNEVDRLDKFEESCKRSLNSSSLSESVKATARSNMLDIRIDQRTVRRKMRENEQKIEELEKVREDLNSELTVLAQNMVVNLVELILSMK